MNDRFRFRIPITDKYGKFKKFFYFDLFNQPAITCRASDIFQNVEQCTGLKDSAGKKIYEGDIVKRISKHDEEEPTVLLQIEWNNKGGRYITTDKKHSTWTFSMFNYFYEVIGNIHENPELLEDK